MSSLPVKGIYRDWGIVLRGFSSPSFGIGHVSYGVSPCLRKLNVHATKVVSEIYCYTKYTAYKKYDISNEVFYYQSNVIRHLSKLNEASFQAAN